MDDKVSPEAVWIEPVGSHGRCWSCKCSERAVKYIRSDLAFTPISPVAPLPDDLKVGDEVAYRLGEISSCVDVRFHPKAVAFRRTRTEEKKDG